MTSRIVMAAILWCCVPRPAFGEPRSIGFHTGWSGPFGDLAKTVGSGTYVGVSLNQPVGQQQLLFLDVSYHVLGDKTTQIIPGYLAARQGLTITETAMGFRAFLASERAPVQPYLKFGLTLDFVDPKLVLDTAYQFTYIHDPSYRGGFLGAAGISVPFGRSGGLRVEGALRGIQSPSMMANTASLGLGFWTRFVQR